MNENADKTVRIPVYKQETKTIPVICPWCNKLYKVSKWEVDFGKKTGPSHGICDKCYREHVKKNGGGS